MVNWTIYNFDYEKEPCYIRYDDGKEIGPCYPNDNSFHVLIPGALQEIEDSRVTHICYISWDEYDDWLEAFRTEIIVKFKGEKK